MPISPGSTTGSSTFTRHCSNAPMPTSSTGLPAALPRRYGFGTDPDSVLTFHHRLLFGTDPSSEVRHRLAGLDGGKAVAVLLSSPEAQLA